MDAQSELNETYKQEIAEQALIYKTEKRELTEFEKKVNEAAVELCLKDTTLLRTRGELLEKPERRLLMMVIASGRVAPGQRCTVMKALAPPQKGPSLTRK